MSPAIYFSCNTWHNGRSISSNYHQCFSLRSVTARHLHSCALLSAEASSGPYKRKARKMRRIFSPILYKSLNSQGFLSFNLPRVKRHYVSRVILSNNKLPETTPLMNKRSRPKRVFLPKGLKTLASLSLCFSSLSRTLDLPLPQQSSSNSTTTMVTICLSPSPATKMEKKC